MKEFLKKAALICLLLGGMATTACDTAKWRAKDYDSRPPSWEHDMGRPDGYGGAEPWR
jgi:hypothetical protein